MKQLKWSKTTRGGFPSRLLGTLVASLLENLLSGKDMKENGQGREAIKEGDRVIQAGDEKIRVGQDFQCYRIFWLMLKYRKHYQNKPKFNAFLIKK